MLEEADGWKCQDRFLSRSLRKCISLCVLTAQQWLKELLRKHRHAFGSRPINPFLHGSLRDWFVPSFTHRLQQLGGKPATACSVKSPTSQASPTFQIWRKAPTLTKKKCIFFYQLFHIKTELTFKEVFDFSRTSTKNSEHEEITSFSTECLNLFESFEC